MLIDREWYLKHQKDISQEEIDDLGIQIAVDGRQLPEIRQRDKKVNFKKLVSALETK